MPIKQAVSQWPLLLHTLAARRSLAKLVSDAPEEPARTPLPGPQARLAAENVFVAPGEGVSMQVFALREVVRPGEPTTPIVPEDAALVMPA
jgi:ATP-binding cassette subfamily C protein